MKRKVSVQVTATKFEVDYNDIMTSRELATITIISLLPQGPILPMTATILTRIMIIMIKVIAMTK